MVSGLGQIYQNDLTIASTIHERKLFKMNPEFLKVIGNPGEKSFTEFVSLAKKAYAILRKNSYIFVTAFNLMIEDKSRSLIDITLQLSVDDDNTAADKFAKELFNL